MGYIVLIPDYRGMGDNYDVHPYCMSSLGQSVSAMITAALAFKPSGAWGRKYSMPWDGRTFLMGFSEGGYATMVAAADIQANHPSFNLLAVAPLDGPYSVSVTMRSVMLTADKDFPAPYFLPFTIAGYGAYNPGIPAIQWGASIVSYPQGFMPKLYTLLDGSHTAGEISNWMRTVPVYKGPITVTSETFQTALNDAGSTVNQALQVNDGFAGWKPATMQIHMFHNKIDDLVPKENTDNAVAAWAGLGNVTATYYPEWLTPMGTVHAGSLPFAYIYGTNWLNSIAMPESAAQSVPPSQ
jgi:pimeloyl-ACP methyl ester carboxylesterase